MLGDLFYDAVSSSDGIALDDRVTDKLERSNNGLIDVLFQNCLDGLRKTMKNVNHDSRILGKIQTEHLLNTSTEAFITTTLPSSVDIVINRHGSQFSLIYIVFFTNYIACNMNIFFNSCANIKHIISCVKEDKLIYNCLVIDQTTNGRLEVEA
jgi:hypothetical protein